jgi:hypothetical protein
MLRCVLSPRLWSPARCSIKRHHLAMAHLDRRLLSSLPDLPLLRALQEHGPSRVAVTHSHSGRSFTYSNLIGDVARARQQLADRANGDGQLSGERVAFLAENSYDYVGIVPLALMRPLSRESIAENQWQLLFSRSLPAMRLRCPSPLPFRWPS